MGVNPGRYSSLLRVLAVGRWLDVMAFNAVIFECKLEYVSIDCLIQVVTVCVLCVYAPCIASTWSLCVCPCIASVCVFIHHNTILVYSTPPAPSQLPYGQQEVQPSLFGLLTADPSLPPTVLTVRAPTADPEQGGTAPGVFLECLYIVALHHHVL